RGSGPKSCDPGGIRARGRVGRTPSSLDGAASQSEHTGGGEGNVEPRAGRGARAFMSGLAGVLFGGRPPDEGTVARMLAAAPHRGSCVETVALGGARLGIVHGEIVDASVASDGRIAAACAGSVMNRDELRGELRLDSARPGDLSDAALLVAAFHRHGSRLPAVLRGNYA